MNWLRKLFAWRPKHRKQHPGHDHRMSPFNRSQGAGWAELDRVKAIAFWNQYQGIK